MQTLAQGVGDLKKVLTNVKTRGIVGEIQLGAILEDILAPEQYETNVATVPNSRNVVEYAVKLPLRTAALSGCRLTPSSRETPTGRSVTHMRKARASRLTHASSN